jgi:hypothetical protein
MERDSDLMTLPLVDDPTVKDVFAEFCTGLNWQAVETVTMPGSRPHLTERANPNPEPRRRRAHPADLVQWQAKVLLREWRAGPG